MKLFILSLTCHCHTYLSFFNSVYAIPSVNLWDCFKVFSNPNANSFWINEGTIAALNLSTIDWVFCVEFSEITAIAFAFRSQIVLEVRNEHVADFLQWYIRNIVFHFHKFHQPPVAAVILREGGRSLADADQFSCILIVFLEKFQQCSLFRRYSQRQRYTSCPLTKNLSE